MALTTTMIERLTYIANLSPGNKATQGEIDNAQSILKKNNIDWKKKPEPTHSRRHEKDPFAGFRKTTFEFDGDEFDMDEFMREYTTGNSYWDNYFKKKKEQEKEKEWATDFKYDTDLFFMNTILSKLLMKTSASIKVMGGTGIKICFHAEEHTAKQIISTYARHRQNFHEMISRKANEIVT